MDFYLCDWFEEDGPTSIHPDDFQRLRKLSPYGKVFCTDGSEGSYVVVKYGDASFRVSLRILKRVFFSPGVLVGDTVRLSDGTAARVLEVHWHHKNAEPIFYLEIGGKRSGRRYSLAEITRP